MASFAVLVDHILNLIISYRRSRSRKKLQYFLFFFFNCFKEPLDGVINQPVTFVKFRPIFTVCRVLQTPASSIIEFPRPHTSTYLDLHVASLVETSQHDYWGRAGGLSSETLQHKVVNLHVRTENCPKLWQHFMIEHLGRFPNIWDCIYLAKIRSFLSVSLLLFLTLSICLVLLSTGELLNLNLVPAESASHPLAMLGPMWLKIFSAWTRLFKIFLIWQGPMLWLF